jgi:hypothetical protein
MSAKPKTLKEVLLDALNPTESSDEKLEFELKIHKMNDTPIEFYNFKNVHQYLKAVYRGSDSKKLLRISVGDGRYELENEEIDNYCYDNEFTEEMKYIVKKRIENGEIPNWNSKYSLSLEKREKIMTPKEGTRYSRYIQRTTFTSDYFDIDISIVIRNADQKKGKIYTGIHSYEIEIELRPESREKIVLIMDDLRKCMMNVHIGLQNTYFPINRIKYEQFLGNSRLLRHSIHNVPPPILEKPLLLGPKPRTLKRDHCEKMCRGETSYMITNKADGEHRILIVSNTDLFMIDSHKNIINVGSCILQKLPKEPENNKVTHIFDGELVVNERGSFYYVYDYYYMTSGPNFAKSAKTKIYELELGARIQLARLVVDRIECDAQSHFSIMIKEYVGPFVGANIFTRGCRELLDREPDNYTRDGLILMPTHGLSLGQISGDPDLAKAATRPLECYKWKFPEMNTIDFLVRKLGKPVGELQPIQLFMFSPRKAYDDLDSFKYFLNIDLSNCESFTKTLPKPVNYHTLFQPDQQDGAVINQALVRLDEYGNMKLNSGESTFSENQIVEFSFNLTNSSWVPLRVRLDKENANYIDVAKDVYDSLLENITKGDLLSMCDKYKAAVSKAKGYYHLSSEHAPTNTYNNRMKKYVIDYTMDLLHRHQHVREATVIDFSVGQGGDLGKLFNYGTPTINVHFVLGIDIDPGNIRRAIDRYINRFLSMCTPKSVALPTFTTLFVCGDSTKSIKKHKCIRTDVNEDLQIMSKRVLNTMYPKTGDDDAADMRMLGNASRYIEGVRSNNFDMSMCQFSIHYFFESGIKFDGFIQNVIECTKQGGYFIGTCVDGTILHNTFLKDVEFGKTFNIKEDDLLANGPAPIVAITKEYENDEKLFHLGDNDEYVNNLGKKIRYKLKTSNIDSQEWLVNLDFLIKKLEETNLFTHIFHKTFEQVEDDKDFNVSELPMLTNNRKQLNKFLTMFVFQKRPPTSGKKTETKIVVTDVAIDYVVAEKRGLEEEEEGKEVVVVAKKSKKSKK